MFKVKPKEILVDLPSIIPFDSIDETNQFVASINSIIHGKVKLKFQDLGKLNDKHMCIVYLQRNIEYQKLYDSFRQLIDSEEKLNYSK